jgi:hypothetical protein
MKNTTKKMIKKDQAFRLDLFYSILFYIVVHPHHCNLTNHIIALTISHDSQIMAIQIAAFFKIPHQAS